MAWAHVVPSIPSSCVCRISERNSSDSSDYSCKENHRVWVCGIPRERISSGTSASRVSVGLHSRNADFVTARWRLNAVDTHIAQSAPTRTSVEIPVTCYRIEESLEELAPACTLELLGLPHLPENAERRRGAISALRELLRQGLDVETPCQVQDWPCFFSQALSRLLASEIIDLLPWDDLAITRKNKKSLESQNQRVVIDYNCYYVALMAHIALGFSSKQITLINKAKIICDCLIASEGIDLKLEEAFCLFLLGEVNIAEVVEKLQLLELNSNPAARNSVTGKDVKDASVANASGANQLLEKWLKDAVLAVFPDTRGFPPSLVNFFNSEKKIAGSKKIKGAPQNVVTVNHRPLSNTLVSERRDYDESLSRMNSSQNLGTAVKQLAPIDLQSSLILDKNSSGSAPSVQLKRNIGMHHNKGWESWLVRGDLLRSFTSVAVLGCIIFATFKLTRIRTASKWVPNKSYTHASSLAWTTDYSVDNNVVPAYIKGNRMAGRFKKLFTRFTKKSKEFSNAGDTQMSFPAAGLSSSMAGMSRKHMLVEEAEALVKQWQIIKAEALGPSYQVHSLSEILDESMLVQWHDLADAAKARSCYWRFVLLELSVLRAEILSNGIGAEMAEIDAVLVEAAELVSESEQKNPNYYSTYKIRYALKRQNDGSWRFCKGDILTSS
ncbi:hypothetical protein FNV43_RR21115 [Rhamnella rubrinervis]|uniref:ARC6 IMS domain-containing protein n=1 Tax=Rhamnella rubrinervis TaxID=2594499 RepID=A0A8K0E042_9ROSA|nr:hypothetical protein FNV43_RR21115 [Rhamnella rubrinervis]